MTTTSSWNPRRARPLRAGAAKAEGN